MVAGYAVEYGSREWVTQLEGVSVDCFMRAQLLLLLLL